MYACQQVSTSTTYTFEEYDPNDFTYTDDDGQEIEIDSVLNSGDDESFEDGEDAVYKGTYIAGKPVTTNESCWISLDGIANILYTYWNSNYEDYGGSYVCFRVAETQAPEGYINGKIISDINGDGIDDTGTNPQSLYIFVYFSKENGTVKPVCFNGFVTNVETTAVGASYMYVLEDAAILGIVSKDGAGKQYEHAAFENGTYAPVYNKDGYSGRVEPYAVCAKFNEGYGDGNYLFAYDFGFSGFDEKYETDTGKWGNLYKVFDGNCKALDYYVGLENNNTTSESEYYDDNETYYTYYALNNEAQDGNSFAIGCTQNVSAVSVVFFNKKPSGEYNLEIGKANASDEDYKNTIENYKNLSSYNLNTDVFDYLIGNAEFSVTRVYTDDENNEEETNLITTYDTKTTTVYDSNVDIEDVNTTDTYIIQEISAPEGYQLYDKKIKIEISKVKYSSYRVGINNIYLTIDTDGDGEFDDENESVMGTYFNAGVYVKAITLDNVVLIYDGTGDNPLIYIIIADEEIGGTYDLNLGKISENDTNSGTEEEPYEYITDAKYEVKQYLNISKENYENVINGEADINYFELTSTTITSEGNLKDAFSDVAITDTETVDLYTITETENPPGYNLDTNTYLIAVTKTVLDQTEDDGTGNKIETGQYYYAIDEITIYIMDADGNITKASETENSDETVFKDQYNEFIVKHTETSISFIHIETPTIFSYDLYLGKIDENDCNNTFDNLSDLLKAGAEFNIESNIYTPVNGINSSEVIDILDQGTTNKSSEIMTTAGETSNETEEKQTYNSITNGATFTKEDADKNYHIYKIVETKAPDGFAEITADNQAEYTWYLVIGFGWDNTNNKGYVKNITIYDASGNQIGYLNSEQTYANTKENFILNFSFDSTKYESENNVATITLVTLNSKYEGSFDLEINKVDFSGSSIDTAKFDVKVYEDENFTKELTDDNILVYDNEQQTEVDLTGIETKNGSILIEDIKILNEYIDKTLYFKVVETEAPEGYKELNYDITFSITFSKDGNKLIATYNEDSKATDGKTQSGVGTFVVEGTKNNGNPTVTITVYNNEISGDYKIYLEKYIVDDNNNLAELDPTGIEFTVYRYAEGTDYNDITAGGTGTDNPLKFTWQKGETSKLIATVAMESSNINNTDTYVISEDTSSTTYVGLQDNITVLVNKKLDNDEYKIESVNISYLAINENGETFKNSTTESSISNIALEDGKAGKLDITVDETTGNITLQLYNRLVKDTYDLQLIKAEYSSISTSNIVTGGIETLEGRYFDVWESNANKEKVTQLKDDAKTGTDGKIDIASDLVLDGETDYFIIEETYPSGNDDYGYFMMSNTTWYVTVTQNWNNTTKKYEISTEVKYSVNSSSRLENTIASVATSYIDENEDGSIVKVYIPNNKTDFTFDITKVNLADEKVEGSSFNAEIYSVGTGTINYDLSDPNEKDEDIDLSNMFLQGYSVRIKVTEETAPSGYTKLFKDGGYITINVKFGNDGTISSATYSVTNAVDNFDEIIKKYLEDNNKSDIITVNSGVDNNGEVYNKLYLYLPNIAIPESGSVLLNKHSSDGTSIQNAKFSITKYVTTAGEITGDYETIIESNGEKLDDLTTESAESNIDKIEVLETNNDYYYLLTEEEIPEGYMGVIKSAIVKIYYSNETWQSSIIAVKTFDNNAEFTTEVSKYEDEISLTSNQNNSWTLNWLNNIETPYLVKAKVKKIDATNNGNPITEADLVLKNNNTGESVSTYGKDNGESDYITTELTSVTNGQNYVTYAITENSTKAGYTNILKGKTLYLRYAYTNDEIDGKVFSLDQSYIVYNGSSYYSGDDIYDDVMEYIDISITENEDTGENEPNLEITITVKNPGGYDITINKNDIVGNGLDGAFFEVTDISGKINFIWKTTSENTTATINVLEDEIMYNESELTSDTVIEAQYINIKGEFSDTDYAIYYFYEISAPEGYDTIGMYWHDYTTTGITHKSASVSITITKYGYVDIEYIAEHKEGEEISAGLEEVYVDLNGNVTINKQDSRLTTSGITYSVSRNQTDASIKVELAMTDPTNVSLNIKKVQAKNTQVEEDTRSSRISRCKI